MTWLLWRLLLPHVIANHTNSTIYQFGFALLLSLVDARLSKVGATLGNLLLTVDACCQTVLLVCQLLLFNVRGSFVLGNA